MPRQLLTAEEKKARKRAYNKRYYREHADPQVGCTVAQMAKIKMVSPRAIYNNLDKFDILPGFKPLRLKFNKRNIDLKLGGFYKNVIRKVRHKKSVD